MRKIDVTDRAVSGGWTLPTGWTVRADTSPDYDTGPVDDEGLTRTQHVTYDQGDWEYVVVSVWVQDNASREWGRSVIGGVEAGELTHTDEDDNVTGRMFSDPLTDNPAEYSPIREYDMIGEALREAVAELERFGTPVLVEPTTEYSGL